MNVQELKAKTSEQLITQADCSDISSSFSMEEIKYTTALPVDYIK